MGAKQGVQLSLGAKQCVQYNGCKTMGANVIWVQNQRVLISHGCKAMCAKEGMLMSVVCKLMGAKIFGR